jgi:hypothetical protein
VSGHFREDKVRDAGLQQLGSGGIDQENAQRPSAHALLEVLHTHVLAADAIAPMVIGVDLEQQHAAGLHVASEEKIWTSRAFSPLLGARQGRVVALVVHIFAWRALMVTFSQEFMRTTKCGCSLLHSRQVCSLGPPLSTRVW